MKNVCFSKNFAAQQLSFLLFSPFVLSLSILFFIFPCFLPLPRSSCAIFSLLHLTFSFASHSFPPSTTPSPLSFSLSLCLDKDVTSGCFTQLMKLRKVHFVFHSRHITGNTDMYTVNKSLERVCWIISLENVTGKLVYFSF